MTPLGWVLLGVAAGAAAVDWWAVWTATPRARAVERVAKPATLLALIAVAVVTPPAVPALRPWLVVALAASLAGDVLLLPPGRLAFGLVAFLGAHLAYTAAFLQLGGSDWATVAGSTAAFAVIAFVGRDIVQAARPAGLAMPVAAYLLVILLMAVTATRTLIPAAVLGAWLFVASDAMLGWGEFVAAATSDGAHRGGPRLRLGVITTYHAAQACLVVALLGV